MRPVAGQPGITWGWTTTPQSDHTGRTQWAGSTVRSHSSPAPRAARVVRTRSRWRRRVPTSSRSTSSSRWGRSSTRCRSADDLDETVRQVEALGRRIVAYEADVRDVDTLQKAFDDGVAELGPVTIVVANAGIGPGRPRDTRAAVGRGHRCEPDGRLEHRPRRHPLDDRERPGRLDHPHQLDRRSHRLAVRRPRHVRLHRGQARRHRSDALVGQLPGAAQHPVQQRGSHHRGAPRWRTTATCR